MVSLCLVRALGVCRRYTWNTVTKRRCTLLEAKRSLGFDAIFGTLLVLRC